MRKLAKKKTRARKGKKVAAHPLVHSADADRMVREDEKDGKVECRRSESPRVRPPFWVEFSPPKPGQRFFAKGGVLVLITEEKYNGHWWRHVSVSRRFCLPTWEEMREVKDAFVGVNKKAVIVLPPKKEYVNLHPFCLHLWCNLQHDPLPDFTAGVGVI